MSLVLRCTAPFGAKIVTIGWQAERAVGVVVIRGKGIVRKKSSSPQALVHLEPKAMKGRTGGRFQKEDVPSNWVRSHDLSRQGRIDVTAAKQANAANEIV